MATTYDIDDGGFVFPRKKDPTPLPPPTDLDAYRKQREEEGTWPPNAIDTLEYWRARRREDKKRSEK